MKIENSQRGQSLIEVLIALAAAVAIVAAIAVTVVTSLSNVDFTKNQNLATQYSREGLEVVRQLAKNNWKDFTNAYKNTNYCLADVNLNPALTPMQGLSCDQNVGLQNGRYIFKRQIVIYQNDGKCSSNGNVNVRVQSIVSWSDSKCQTGNPFCHNVLLESCLADINTIIAP